MNFKTFPADSIGIVTLFRELNAHVVFVSARPEFVRGVTARTLARKFHLHGATLLLGKLRDSLLIPFAPGYSNRKISGTKYENYLRYQQLFPECNFLWFGDSGQADIALGEMLLSCEVLSR